MIMNLGGLYGFIFVYDLKDGIPDGLKCQDGILLAQLYFL